MEEMKDVKAFLESFSLKMKNMTESLSNSIMLCDTLDKINSVKTNFLGKSGELTLVQKSMRDFPQEARPEIGKIINSAKAQMTELIEQKETVLKQSFNQSKLLSEKIDVTIPAKKSYIGSEHPLNIVKNQIIEIFLSLGFEIEQGFEVETDYYNFQALNIPEDHPAREMQDTFYVADKVVLRTHTSPAQVRKMENTQPPIRMLCPGRVYRADDDATHSPVFHQIEGLVIDKKITLCDLKGILDLFAKNMFSSETDVRLRPSYFPFTEPSIEVDVSCPICHGNGCKLCKGTGWIEILGAGIVNRNVLINCNLNPDEYTGFAFGFGIERIAMIKYGIPDIRLFYENDLRLLRNIR